MLDLVLFGSSLLFTAYISTPVQCRNINDTSFSSASAKSKSASSDDGIEKAANFRRRRDDTRGSLALSAIIHGGKKSPQPKVVHSALIFRASRFTFQASLLSSLWLFSLSTLEAAPTPWLLVIHRPLIFVRLYRLILWALCLLLILIIPAILGEIVALAVSGDTKEPLSSSTSSPSLVSDTSSSSISASSFTPSMKRKEKDEINSYSSDESRRSNTFPFLLFLKLLRISINFLFFAIWWSLRRLSGIVFAVMLLKGQSSNTRDPLDEEGRPSRYRRIRSLTGKLCLRWRLPLPVGSFIGILTAVTFALISICSIGSFVLNSALVANIGDRVEGHRSTYDSWSPLKSMVKNLSSLGMIVASTLNGFGCASLPHANLAGLYLKPTSPTLLAKIEEDYFFTLKSLEEKRWELTEMQTTTVRSAPQSRVSAAMAIFRERCHLKKRFQWDRSSSQSFGNLSTRNQIQDGRQKMESLCQEITFLENLAGDMNDGIEEMKHSQQLALAARTSIGRIRGILGIIFSIILVARVALAAHSFLFSFRPRQQIPRRSSSPKDPITNALLWLLGHHIVSEEQYELCLQGTSLILAGILSISQVKTFLRVVGALGRKLSRVFNIPLGIISYPHSANESFSGSPQAGAGASKNKWGSRNGSVPILIFSFVMGCYFLSCVIVMKMNLPIEYRDSFSTAVGNLDFEFNMAILNMVFTASACTSAVVLGLLFGIQRNNSERYYLESQSGPFGVTENVLLFSQTA